MKNAMQLKAVIKKVELMDGILAEYENIYLPHE